MVCIFFLNQAWLNSLPVFRTVLIFLLIPGQSLPLLKPGSQNNLLLDLFPQNPRLTFLLNSLNCTLPGPTLLNLYHDNLIEFKKLFLFPTTFLTFIAKSSELKESLLLEKLKYHLLEKNCHFSFTNLNKIILVLKPLNSQTKYSLSTKSHP